MTDGLWEQLHYDDDNSWSGFFAVTFGNREYDVDLVIQADDDQTEITECQKQSFLSFTEKWTSIELVLVDALIHYYNQEENYSYGPENEEEAALRWPDINTYQELVNAVTPASIVIPPDYLMNGGRKIFLLFGRTWGGEDLDDNGVGVCFINEQISEIGYKDIAF